MSAPYVSWIRGLFRPSLVDNDGVPLPFTWLSDDWTAICFNPNSMKVYARVWHDGCGKFHPTIYVSPWKAMLLLSQGRSVIVKLRSFPRIALEFNRLKRFSIDEAIEDFEVLMKVLKIV